MATADDYARLQERFQNLKERRAALASLEEDRRTRREALEAQLREAGIDVSDLPAERRRLETEIQEVCKRAEERVEAFEHRLREAEQGRVESDAGVEIE